MLTLVIGGTRSGKSEVAEGIAAAESSGVVTYLAPCAPPGEDAAMAARIAAHRERRPPGWRTVEQPGPLHLVLEATVGVVLLDSLGTWLAARPHDDDPAELDALVASLEARTHHTIVVSEEVGLSVHAPTEAGRRFADRLGELNRRVAEVADRCLLVIAGRIVELPPGARGAATGSPPSPSPALRRLPRPSLSALGEAIAFLTPFGRAGTPGRDAPLHFPLVGAALGLVLGFIWTALDPAAPPLVLAALLVAADLALTGMLHVDGFADAADGLLAHLPRRHRLAIMAEPHVGAFALAAVPTALILRVASLASFSEPRPLLLASLWCASRTTMGVTVGALPYARPAGLASPMTGATPWPTVAFGAALSLALAAATGGFAMAAVAATALGAGGVTWIARRRLGGFTGDTVGAAGFAGETIGLVAASIFLPQ